MKSLWHWLTELAEVYARHAGRHGPNRLLPAEVLPTHDCVPGHGGTSPQGTGSDRCTTEHSAPKACTPRGST
jgi:hypothetical protein